MARPVKTILLSVTGAVTVLILVMSSNLQSWISADWTGVAGEGSLVNRRQQGTTLGFASNITEDTYQSLQNLTRSSTRSSTPSGTPSSTPSGQCHPDLRVQALRRACLRHDTSNVTKSFGHHFLYVSDEHRYVACLPLKAGCSTWKVILVNNTLQTPLHPSFSGGSLHMDGLKKYKIYRLDSYSEADQQRILDTYYKFLVARHPLDRLISGHNDKILKGAFMSIRNQIIKLAQKTHNYKSKEQLYDLTAFFEFILRQEYTMDHHWFPTVGLCDPCNVNYDKIVKLETQSTDLLDVVPHLGPYGRGLNIQRNHQGSGAASTFTWSRQTLEQVPRDLLQAVMKIGYDMDMELFGYSYNSSAPTELKCQYDGLGCC